MPLTPSFTVSQTSGLPSIINLTDNSTGSDAAISSRVVFIQRNDGTYLVPTGTLTNYIVWSYANPTIAIDVLKKDMAVQITVQWLSNTAAILYTANSLNLFTLYLKTFFYSLTQYQASNKSITQNNNFYGNKSKLWGYIKGAETAVQLAGDISGAQNELDAATQMINSEKMFF